MDSQTPTSPHQPASNKPKSRVLWWLIIVILLVCLAALGILYKRKLDENNNLKNTVSSINSTNASLSSSNAKLKAQVADLTPAKNPLALTASGSIHYSNYTGVGFDTNDFLIVTVSIKNTGPQPAKFSRSDLVLKDKSNNSYPLATDSSIKSQPRFSGGITGLPNDESEIGDQTIAAGATVNGVVVFYVPKTLNSFSLIYTGQSQQITAS